MPPRLEHLPEYNINHIQCPPQCPFLGVKQTLIGGAGMLRLRVHGPGGGGGGRGGGGLGGPP